VMRGSSVLSLPPLAVRFAAVAWLLAVRLRSNYQGQIFPADNT
jgi:hypothetical protein